MSEPQRKDMDMGDVVPLRFGELVDADHDGNPDTAHDDDLTPADEYRVEAKVFDAELVDEPAKVDQPETTPRSAVRTALTRKATERRPVLPPWVTSRDELRFVATWLVRHIGHVSAFHAVRSPVYALTLLLRAPAGAAKSLGGVGRWVFDSEGAPLRAESVRRNDPDGYLKLARVRQQRVRARLITAALGLGVLLAVVLLLAFVAAGWIVALVLAAAVVALGWVGAPADKPIAGPAVIVQKAQRLTSEQVVRALRAVGIAAMTTKGAELTFPAPITRDGPGWRADVDLPHGVTAGDVIERRDRLASGLRRPLGCCWPEPAPEQHAGRLVLWVGDEDMAKARQPAWPLRKARKFSVFEAIPFGTDQRGRPVGVDLMYSNLLIGALPGAGKTFALRVVLLGAAMDAHCELRLFELKGSGDLDPLEPICHHYGSGVDDATLAACLASLREVAADLEVRAATVKRLAKAGRCPENKVTPDLAADRTLGLWPVLVVVDECQELFSHPEYGKDAATLCTAIIKRGRAFGVMLALATQRPDKDSLPKAISDNVGVRYCLRVVGNVANDMILGTSMYQAGIRATMLRPSDKGVGYLVGATDEPQIVRGYYLDGDAATNVVKVARMLREQAGTLTGAAVGETQQVVNVLDDVLTVAAGAERLWSSVILDRLAALRPEVYQGWTAEQLAAALRPFGGRSRDVWGTGEDGTGTTRRGYVLAELTRPDNAKQLASP